MGIDELPNPFAELGSDLSDSEIRETAYEILIAACRSSGGRPLTYVSKAAPERLPSLSSVPSLQRSLPSTAASKVKKALGFRSSKKKKSQDLAGQENPGPGRSKKPVTVGELIRLQMRVSEQTDSRIRRGLLRIAAGQLGKRMESIVLPLEQLQHIKPSDFPNQQEYELWQRRNFKIIEAGLLLHPYFPLDKQDTNRKELQKIIRGALERPIEMGEKTESMHVLRTTVMSLASRSFDGSVSEICHWADGAPLNLRLYQMLLESCFDVNEATSIVEEVDDVLEVVKKTWVILGINEMLHNLCFSWVLFHRYVTTGQIDNDLLSAANNLLMEVEKDRKPAKDSACSKFFSSTLSLILGWAEKKLLAYHDTFHSGNVDLMQASASLAVSASKILAHDISREQRGDKQVDVPQDKVDTYIRSSLQVAFNQKMEAIKLSKRSSTDQRNHLPVLSILAQDITELALIEKEIYSPILKQWHPLAAGAAVATLHTCYANKLKQFVSGISELSPDAVQVLLAADKLEKVLVQIAVEDSVESEDGGKAIIQEMTPYEAEIVICGLVKTWITTRVDILDDWVDRNLQQEVWNPRANRERFAPSAVEVLRIMDETLEAFFLLPITMHSVLLPDLMGGLDRCLQQYITKSKSGCGTRITFMPSVPALTRCKGGSKLHGVFRKKEKSNPTLRRKPPVDTIDGDDSFGMLQLCVRINTLHHIRTQLDVVGKRIIKHLKNLRSEFWDDTGKKTFELSEAACLDGIQELCKATAYKVVFHYLSHVLMDSLYVGEVSSSRVEPFLQELEQHLEIISVTVHDKVRTRLITDVMRASFEGFLLVLLAGGPCRAFSKQDCDIIEEDFKFLMDLFWSNGDGLPAELVDKLAVTVKRIFPLFRSDTESLIAQFRNASAQDGDNNLSVKTKQLQLPQTTGIWSPTEPNTILRVLCHRNDDMATKFLKKTYNLPKKL